MQKAIAAALDTAAIRIYALGDQLAGAKGGRIANALNQTILRRDVHACSDTCECDDNSPEAVEYRAARKALAEDPVNRGDLGYVGINSPAGRANLAAQDRLTRAERAYRAR